MITLNLTMKFHLSPLKTFFTSTTVRFLDIINTALAWQLGVLLEHSSISKTNN